MLCEHALLQVLSGWRLEPEKQVRQWVAVPEQVAQFELQTSHRLTPALE